MSNYGKKVAVHYRGTLDDGTEFDSSYSRNEPLKFTCMAGMMIPGFDKAVEGMEVGETVTVRLEPEDAYGMPDPNMIVKFSKFEVPEFDDLKVGDQVMSGPEADIKPGNALPLKNIPVGTLLHNVELKIGAGAQLVRSAGAYAQLMAIEGDYATLRMPSGEMRKVHVNCRATIGVVGNAEHMNITIGKAGRSRWMGKRPENRGVAMNPNDHPHGGGEGRSPVGRKHPVTKWGKCAMGAKTRRKKASDKLIIKGRTK